VIADGVSQVVSALNRFKVLIDTNEARRAAMAAILASADPSAKLLSDGEDAALYGDAEGSEKCSVEKKEALPEGICYLKFSGLRRGQGERAAQDVLSAARASDKGIVLDLRGAAGTGWDGVIPLAGLFVSEDCDLFCMRDDGGIDVERHRNVLRESVGCPAVILTDRQTSGALETLAAVVKRAPGVLLIGSPTSGDARVREKVLLPNGEALYVGVRRVVPLRGTAYETTGVQPDITVALQAVSSGETTAKDASHEPRSGTNQTGRVSAGMRDDPVVRRAVDILVGLEAMGSYVRQ
jgi:C-terminal processing protease CtpA/Prc